MAEIMVRYDDLRRYCEKRHCGSVPIEYIKQMPTLEAEPVRNGHWMFLEQKSGYLWKCSNCKGNFDQLFSYCPYCGAEMDTWRGERRCRK